MVTLSDSSILRGAMTALVTPMNRDGSLDLGALDALVQWQIEQGIHGLVPCGTTGEAATLTLAERETVIARVVQTAAGKVPVIGGAGGNDTKVAIDAQKVVKAAGADYALVATPAYNKPNTEGLKRHYEMLLESVDIPIVMYNVPSRTGCDMSMDLMIELAQHEEVVGVKEATGDMSRVRRLCAETPKNFALLSGDDFSAATLMWLGGHGVISVSSNIIPSAFAELAWASLEGELLKARQLHHHYTPLFEAMFWDSNPIPVKGALHLMGIIQNTCRMPLCPATRELLDALKKIGTEYDLLNKR